MPEIISRAEAKQRGQRYYFTGQPCVNGHVSRRLVKNYTCLECENRVFGRQPPIIEEKKCAVCGAIGLLRGHVTCSSACSAAWGKNRGRRKRIMRGLSSALCVGCGSSMEWAYYKTRYCSEVCRLAASKAAACFPKCSWCGKCGGLIDWRKRYCLSCKPKKNKGKYKYNYWRKKTSEEAIARRRQQCIEVSAAVAIAMELGLMPVRAASIQRRRSNTKRRRRPEVLHPQRWGSKRKEVWNRVINANPRIEMRHAKELFLDLMEIENLARFSSEEEKAKIRERQRSRHRVKKAIYEGFKASGLI